MLTIEDIEKLNQQYLGLEINVVPNNLIREGEALLMVTPETYERIKDKLKPLHNGNVEIK